MLRTIGGKRLQLLVLTLIMSAFLIFTTSFAFGEESAKYKSNPAVTMCSSSALIKADTGGNVYLGPTMGLYVPKYAVAQDTVITASFKYKVNKPDIIEFEFGPSPSSFSVPLELFMSWSDIANFGLLNDPTLYYNGVPVASSESDWGVTYYLDHFSIYYFERR